ncbi:hypothetical protein M758_6G186100 [Ceratodon purpureus]|nr:hypothetical protein M758_6G186100 [Ceratodon purpureus]
MSSVSTIADSCSRGNSIVFVADKQTCRSKLCTSSLSFKPKFRSLGLEAELSSSGLVSMCSGCLRGRFGSERCFHSGDGVGRHSAIGIGCRDARQRHICASSEQLGGMAVEESVCDESMDRFVEVVHKLADAARVITLKYFRSKFQIIDKADLSPVTIADRSAELAMRELLAEHCPSHSIYGEEWGLTEPEGGSDYVWVLDPIDGTKSFITGKPVFGTLIALMHKGVPVLGVIDQPVLQERWLGIQGRVTTLNGVEIQTRATALLKDSYLYTTSPHLFAGDAEKAFIRVRNEVKVPLYGCDCYAYGLLAAGHVDLVVESGLKPYDYLALVPVVEGAGGVITNWSGQKLRWLPEVGEVGIEVIAAGNASVHEAALQSLAWKEKTTRAKI